MAVTCGDPSYIDQIRPDQQPPHEGTAANDPDGQDASDAYTADVDVTDGRLSIRPGASALKLNANAVQPGAKACVFVDGNRISTLNLPSSAQDVSAGSVLLKPGLHAILISCRDANFDLHQLKIE